MDRFLVEQQATGADPVVTEPQNTRSRVVEMESIRSSDRGSNWEYDPDDIDFPAPAQATVATAASGSTASTMIQRVRISAISDLKEFTGKDQDEDRGRAWISKVKSVFMRDQASDDEKCLTFAELLAGSAKDWYRQLSRTTRNKWSDLLHSFQIQYCGLGVSVARQYYHMRRRSDESPLDYLYRLHVAGLRARLKIKDGSAKERREHVDHYIETLEDEDLAERLTLLRLTDADDLEDVLRARDRAKNRQKKAAFGSGKYRQKTANTTQRNKCVRSRSKQTNLDPTANLTDRVDPILTPTRQPPIFLAASEDVTPKVEKESASPDPRLPDRDHGHQEHNLKIHGNGFNRDRSVSGLILRSIREYDQIYYPVMFASRTLKSNELNYGIAEKEVLALLRILDLNYNALVGRPIRVLTRHSTLAWLFRSKALQGRLGQWAALLSPWTLEITKCVKGEDEILGALAASITPRSQVDKALILIAPKKEPRRKIQAPIPTTRLDENLYVVSFDRSARVKRGGGAYNAILWKLPEWRVLKARSGYAEGRLVSEAEYHGLLLCLDLLEDLDPRRLVICGDSNLVIRQVRGEIDCKAPGLTLLLQQALDRLRTWPDHELLHVKRDADSLASAALQRQ
ncbi:LOW QUALITY PROTEIN: reverse transcriptase, partial [Phytophthora megakarya]